MRFPKGALGLVLTGFACTSVRQVQPAEFIPQHHPQSVLVTTTDSDVTNVVAPRMDGDTLRGTVAGLQERVAIPLKDIVSVRAKTPDGMKTAILVTGSAILAGGLAYMILTAGNSNTAPTPGGAVLCSDPDGAC